jgi:uncharacterized protein YecE (DUF72 family)
MPASTYIGTSGWSYRDWRGRFYPDKLPTSRWLAHYAQRFDTVEVNATFYRLPSERAADRWRETVPDGFQFAVKASRLITHYRRLVDVDDALRTFFDRLERLGPKLGPILFQLPPDMDRDDGLLDDFLAKLPDGYSYILELRNPAWYDGPIFSLMERRRIALCLHDMPGSQPPLIATADVVYVRFHGPTGHYRHNYPDDALQEWAARLRDLTGNGARLLYAYFNNDIGGAAVEDAERLRKLMAQSRTN